MILTHFPEDETYQFLEKPVTLEEFTQNNFTDK